MSDLKKSFYCSQKFTWLSVDLEKSVLYSCCNATAEKINMPWLTKNSGQLFNTPTLIQERQQMLLDQPVTSCYKSCWEPESKNLSSRRTQLKTTEKTHTELTVDNPEILNIILGTTCNLTCVYCCKQYSSSWFKDIASNGSYLDHPRFVLTEQEKILSKLSQVEIENSGHYQTLLNELTKFENIKEVHITGGEPFLYNNLHALLENLHSIDKISIATGLGVNNKRFQRLLEKIQDKSKIALHISAENIDKSYEFNRYGNSWKNFNDNLNYLLDNKFPVEFRSVLSNLTLFGLIDFYNKFQNFDILYIYCRDPDFLSPNVLDDTSKAQLTETIVNSSISNKQSIIDTINQPCSEQQRQNLSVYLKEFASRRQLSLDIFPKNLLQWLNLT